MHKNLGEDRTYSSEDMIADRQTNTHTHRHRQTRSSQYSALPYRGGVKKRKLTDDGMPGSECLPAPRAQTTHDNSKNTVPQRRQKEITFQNVIAKITLNDTTNLNFCLTCYFSRAALCL